MPFRSWPSSLNLQGHTFSPINTTIFIEFNNVSPESTVTITADESTNFYVEFAKEHETEFNSYIQFNSSPCFLFVRMVALVSGNFKGLIYLKTGDKSTVTIPFNLSAICKNQIKTLREPIGKGGFSHVYKGEFEGKVAAFKALKLIKREYSKYFWREALNLQNISSDYIVKFYGVAERKKEPIFILEYVPETLIDKYKKGFLSDEFKYLCFLEIAKGMEFLHQREIAHRDLKPENIGVMSFDIYAPIHVKILDFGLSRQIESNAVVDSSAILGSVCYMAPECFCTDNSDQKFSLASDVYSFAVTVWSIWCEEIPYKGCGNIMKAIVDGRKLCFPEKCLFKSVMESCFDSPKERPTFSQIVTELSAITSKLIPDYVTSLLGQITSYEKFIKKMCEERVSLEDKIEKLEKERAVAFERSKNQTVPCPQCAFPFSFLSEDVTKKCYEMISPVLLSLDPTFQTTSMQINDLFGKALSSDSISFFKESLEPFIISDCLFDSEIHPKTSESFHKQCDMKGPTLTLLILSVHSEHQYLCGLSSSSWFSPDVPSFSLDEFATVFLLNDTPKKSTCNGIWSDKSKGPIFGNNEQFDLSISFEDNQVNERSLFDSEKGVLTRMVVFKLNKRLFRKMNKL